MIPQPRRFERSEPIRLRPAVLDLIASSHGDPADPGFDEARFLAHLREIVTRVETPGRRLLAKYRTGPCDALGRILARRD